MKCCDITTGKLKSRITIQRRASVDDGMGGKTDGWTTIAQPFTWWKVISGSERWQAMRVSPQKRVRAIIRFKGNAEGNPLYSSNERVLYRGFTYAIEAVTDIEDSQTWLELMLVQGEAS